MEERTWQTKDGTILKISEMDTPHITNCLNFIKKTARKGVSVVYGDASEEGAEAWGEVDLLVGKEALNLCEPQYSWLKEELKKRKNLFRNKTLKIKR